jgi:hypothetical protein
MSGTLGRVNITDVMIDLVGMIKQLLYGFFPFRNSILLPPSTPNIIIIVSASGHNKSAISLKPLQ